ncbi:MAG: putative lipid II flippase FtsW [bacterium]|nr:putative lipid II flippase FtsW [bacterium]
MKRLAQNSRTDFVLLAASLLLLLFGLLMIYNASPVTSLRDFGDPWHLVKQQGFSALAALGAGVVGYRIHYKFWENISPLLIIGAIILLLMVFIPGLGVKVYGAQRWLNIGGFGIQPAELAKLAYIIYLSAWLSRKIKLAPFLIVTAILAGIVLLQRDFGTAAIIALTGGAIYFLSGAALWQFLFLVPAGLVSALVFILSSDYRRARFLTFLNPSLDTQGAAYHISQILIALGSGGWWGVGLGQSRQKYGYIPEVTTDSIFAVIGNELGLIGSVLLVGVFVLIVLRGFKIARQCKDRFGQLLAAGIASWLGLQAFINLAGMVALLPLTGVPLPFISFGGSSLVSVVFGVALLLNIAKNNETSPMVNLQPAKRLQRRRR